MAKETGLFDDYGTPIKDGDTIEWKYKEHGLLIKNEDGTESFIGGFGGGVMEIREAKKTKTILYEIRGDMAGYFLDRPNGLSMTFILEKPKCKVL